MLLNKPQTTSLLAVMLPQKLKGQEGLKHRLITCCYYLKNEFDWYNYKPFFRNLSKLFIDNITIFRVMTEANFKMSSHKSNFTAVESYFSEDLNLTVTVISLTLESLFTNEIFNNNVLNYKNQESLEALNCFFIFEGFYYSQLHMAFTIKSILISGGSNQLRYSMNPVKFRLSQLINSLEETWYLDNVVSSYFLKSDNLLIKTGEEISSINPTKPIPDMENKVSNYNKSKKASADK